MVQGLDLLGSSASGDKQSTSQIRSLLTRITFGLKDPIEVPQPPKKPDPPIESRPSIFSRPRPQVSGIRRIPYLVSANGIPILRIKKPQPASLSGYLSARVKSRQKKVDQKTLMQSLLSIAQSEDRWDRILRKEVGAELVQETLESSGGSWTVEIRKSIRYLHWWLTDEQDKNHAVARRMVEIIDKETELAEKEEQDRARQQEEETKQKENR